MSQDGSFRPARLFEETRIGSSSNVSSRGAGVRRKTKRVSVGLSGYPVVCVGLSLLSRCLSGVKKSSSTAHVAVFLKLTFVSSTETRSWMCEQVGSRLASLEDKES